MDFPWVWGSGSSPASSHQHLPKEKTWTGFQWWAKGSREAVSAGPTEISLDMKSWDSTTKYNYLSKITNTDIC